MIVGKCEILHSMATKMYYIIDNLRNGLETQAKVYATSVIRFTLEPCNFTLNTFQGFVSTCFKQEQKCESTFKLFQGDKQGGKSPFNVFVDLFQKQQWRRHFCSQKERKHSALGSWLCYIHKEF